MDNYFNSVKIFTIIWNWKWHLGAIGIITAVIAAILSGPFFMKPVFTSKAVIYPANLHSHSEESKTEQMLQWLQSNDLKQSLIDSFNLGEYYKIDSNYKYKQTAVFQELSDHLSIQKTAYESAEITFEDHQPEMAYKMVQSVLYFYNQLIENAYKKKYKEVVNIRHRRLMNKKYEIDSIARVLSNIREKYGIIDYGNQTREITRGYLRTVEGANATNINTPAVMELKKNIEKMGSDFIVYNHRLYAVLEQYTSLQNAYEEAMKNYQKEITYAYVVSEPVIPDKKSKPVRWIIVAVSVFVTVFMALIIIAILENRQSNYKQS